MSADDVSSYLELSLGGESMIHSVTTQGSASVAHWVTSYKIQYVSYDVTRWRTILNADGTDRVFTGNTDQNSTVINELRAGIVADKIRLVPVASSGRADQPPLELIKPRQCLSSAPARPISFAIEG